VKTRGARADRLSQENRSSRSRTAPVGAPSAQLGRVERRRNPDYAIAWRLDRRKAQASRRNRCGCRRRLLASLADSGQQARIVVLAAEGQADRYVVIDGYKRIAALEQRNNWGGTRWKRWCGR